MPIVRAEESHRDDRSKPAKLCQSSLFAEFQSAGVAFHQTLKTEPRGAKGFIVIDPDGNLLMFAGPAD